MKTIKLKEIAEAMDIQMYDIKQYYIMADYVLFSKNGFASEVEKMKDAGITLLSSPHLSSLLASLSKDDLLVHQNKKY